MGREAKGKPKPKDSPKSRGDSPKSGGDSPKSKGKSKSDKKKKQELSKLEKLTQEKSALVIQRIARGFIARRAYASLLALEDGVLRVPTHAAQAHALLSTAPPHRVVLPEPGQEEEKEEAEASKTEGQNIAPEAEGQSIPAKRANPPRSCRRAFCEGDLTDDQVTQHLEALPDSRYTASGIFWFFCTWGLGLEHLHRIFKHHTLRRKNANGQVRVHLVLMQHGDSSRLPIYSPAAGSPEEEGEQAKRTLLPEGWVQVTRTAWSLRIHPEYQPHIIFSSTVPCCMETAERVRKVIDDAVDDLEQQAAGGDAPDSAQGQSEERSPEGADAEYPSQKRPRVRGCGALDLQPLSTAIGPGIHRIVDAVTAALDELPVPPPRDGILPPPFVVMLVAGGVVLEALLACLCAEAKSAVRARLGGGDIVMLESRPMVRVITTLQGAKSGKGAQPDQPESPLGQGEPGPSSPSEPRPSSPTAPETASQSSGRAPSNPEATSRPASNAQEEEEEEEQEPEVQETARPIHELWHDALLRNKWKLSRHVRGQDWGQSNKSRGTASPHPKDTSTMREEWRSYAGEPLIFSHSEFSKLCTRAGSTLMPLAPDMSASLHPLVRAADRPRRTLQPQQQAPSLQRMGRTA